MQVQGRNIRILRDFLGYKQAEFAELINVDPSILSEWENDKKIVTAEGIHRLTEKIPIKPGRLYEVDILKCLKRYFFDQ